MQTLKSFFNKKQVPKETQIESTFDHSKISADQDSSQCPFMKNKMKEQKNTSKQSKCPHPQGQKAAKKASKKQGDQQVESSSDDQQIPRGGCPFMGGSQKKRNPDLFQFNAGFDEPFVSKFAYYLSANKIDFGALKQRKSSVPISKSRQIFNKYPIYLQHSLFYQGQDYKKVRGIECCSRFLPYEKLREKGNKLFNKGKYQLALDYYERSLSLFKWLQHYQPQDLSSSKNNSLEMIQSQQSIQSESLDGASKIHINLNDAKSEKGIQDQEQPSDNQFNDMKDKYKQFFIVYNDSNVRVCDGQEMEQTADIDMRKSLMLQVYLNMAACYIHLSHYQVALQCIEDCFKLSQKVSQIYMRKAQIILSNKASSLQNLEQAKTLIEKAIYIKSTEKIFESNQNMLKMVNLHNADESYNKVLELVKQRINQKQKEIKIISQKIYNRAKQINTIQRRLISQGKTPYQRNQQSMEQSKQFKILLRMRQKYVKVIQFYTEAQNNQQVKLAKNQIQQLLKIFHEMNEILTCDIQQYSQELGGINSEKIQKRIQTIKKNFCEDVYNSRKFNFTVMEWAIKQIIKQQKQEEQFKKKAQNEQKMNNVEQTGIEKKGKYSQIFKKASWGLILLPVVGIVINSFII